LLLGDVGARPGVSCWDAHEIRSGSGESSNVELRWRGRTVMSGTVQRAAEKAVTERYEALLRVSQTLISIRSSEELFRLLARELRAVVNFYVMGVGIYDESAHEIRLTSYGEPGDPLQVPKLAPEETFTWWVYQHQQPLIIPSLDAETRFPAVAEMLKNRGVRSVCVLPLTTVHRRLGGLAVGSTEVDAYSREEVSFLSLVANQVALAVDDALNFDASQQAEEALRAAMSERTRLSAVRAEIGMALARQDTLRGMLHTCAEAMVRHLDAAFARIWTLNSNGQELELQASAGMYTRLDGRYSRIPLGQLKIGLIAQERRAQLTNDVQNDPRIDNKDWARDEKMTSFAGYPLVVEDRIVGVMGMFSQKPLTESTLHTLSFLADGIAQGIQRKQAEEKLRRSEALLAESEQRFRLIVDSIPGLVLTMTAEGELEFVSQQGLDYYGKTLDEVKSWTTSDIVHPDDLSRVVATWRRSVETGHPAGYDYEYRIRRADGVYRWFQVRALPLRDTDGRIIRWYVLSTDIDERKQAEDRLQLLLDVTNQVVSNLQLQDLLRAISASVRRVMHCDLVSVCFPDSELNRLQTFVLDFPDSKGFIREEFFIPMEGSLSGFVFRSGKPWTGSALDILQLGLKDEAAIPEGLKTGCILPLVSRNRILGVLCVGRREENAFSQDDIGFLTQVASQIAIAVENTSAYHEITQARGELEKALGEIQRLKDRLQDENLVLREQIDQALMFEEIVGVSPALRGVLSRVSKVAPTDSTVLLTGETGTGKELIARAIHKRSRRSSRAFVSVNCAAIPSSLIASELFGHEKGAFTGATQRRLGRFELAEEGTLFLDEVGELPAETQIALLRVLQEREFERVGGSQPIRANVRVIAATNRDLEAAIAVGTFRSDLFYRLNVFPIEIPPLRERREDIPLLVEYFIDHFARKAGKSFRGINKKTLELLLSYPWPGNIRELQNVVERSVIVCETENFSVDGRWLSRQSPASEPKSQVELSQRLAAQEKEMIELALRESGGRVSGPSGAAAKLKIHRSTLESKIASLKINKYRFKTANASKK
jgi:formate hydrogenlyase transcriptional activator